MKRICPSCTIEKEVNAENFYRWKLGKDGYARLCKPCSLTQRQAYVEKNRAAINERERVRDQNPEYHTKKLEMTRRWRVRMRAEGKMSEYSHGEQLRRHFKKDILWYNETLEKQGGVCAVCQQTSKQRFSVDHDHTCCPGRASCGLCVRGLLCSDCNLGLGKFEDSIALLSRAIVYLSSYQPATEPLIREVITT